MSSDRTNTTVDISDSKLQMIFAEPLLGGADFVLCMMDQKNVGMYSSIKRVSERKYGILTQCITLKSAKKANPQLCGMVLMKINAKLGGLNVKVHWDGLKDVRNGFL